MMAALTELRLADIDALARINDAGVRADLDALMRRLEADLPLLSDAITRDYLSHATASRQMAAPVPNTRP